MNGDCALRAVALAAVLCLLVLLVYAVRPARGPGAPSRADAFYTGHGQEEPTRAYTPYTGAVPFGHWGTLPWAEAVPPLRGGEPRCYGSACAFEMGDLPYCRPCGGSRRLGPTGLAR